MEKENKENRQKQVGAGEQINLGSRRTNKSDTFLGHLFALFIAYFHLGNTIREKTWVVKLRIDNNFTGFINISPFMAYFKRSQTICERACEACTANLGLKKIIYIMFLLLILIFEII